MSRPKLKLLISGHALREILRFFDAHFQIWSLYHSIMFYTIFGTAKDVSVGPTAVVSVEVLNFNPTYIIIF